MEDFSLRLLARARRLAEDDQARRLRESAGISLRDLASAIGTNPGELSRWERGLSRPRAISAIRWLRACEVIRSEQSMRIQGPSANAPTGIAP